MHWSSEKYNAHLKDLKPAVREKAIELADQFVKNGNYDTEEDALTAAIKQAEEWFMDLEA